jgi:hypothetical protein
LGLTFKSDLFHIPLLQQGLKEEYLPSKDEMVDFFMSMKHKVRIEDLIMYEPIYSSNREKSRCSICKEFANMHCVNCNNNTIWLCVDHLIHHKAESHL